MKYFIATILIIGIIGATASLIMMDHHGSCIMPLLAGAICSDQLNIFAFLNIHFNFLRNFSEGLLASIFAVLPFLTVLIFYSINSRIKSEEIFFSPKKLFDLEYKPQKIELIHWLSLKENSPALL